MACRGPLLFGVETEYSFVAYGPGGTPLDREEVAAELLDHICAHEPHLRDVAELGFFLGSGGRCYLDMGDHPELATRECCDPRELVQEIRAGERLLTAAIRAYEREHPGDRISLSGCSVDYSGSGATWGTHENYLSHRAPPRIAPALTPFLVSRIVFTGAGGFDNQDPAAPFLISPRAPHCPPDLWDERSLLSKADEPLCVGYSRVHVPCSESLRSPLGTWLKVGATALVVRLIDAGCLTAEDVCLRNPREALQTFSRDPRCTERVPLLGNRSVTAIEIQRHFLDAVENEIGSGLLPPWAGALCQAWGKTLDRLAGAPESVADRLDWAIKWRLFQELRSGRGFDTAECQEADVRFGELLPERSLYAALAEAGELADAIPGAEPGPAGFPPTGRAALRSMLVRRFSGSAKHEADWEGVISIDEGSFADLRNPYERELRWKPIAAGSREWREDGVVRDVLEVVARVRAG